MEMIEINGKEYQLDINKAKEQGLLKEKDSKPYSWEEYVKMAEIAQVIPCDAYANYFDKKQKRITYDVFNSVNEAKAFCALGKLIQLRDTWYGNWKPDWDEVYAKYTIVNTKGRIRVSTTIFTSRVLAFPTEEMATEFLETFSDLIEEAKIFL